MGQITKVITATLVLTFGSVSAADVRVGALAPDFRLQDQNGDWHTLEQYRGSWVAVYFYPKDDTPGCTTEACAFRDNIFAFEELGATILGISLDDVESHQAFAEKYSLPFSLLSDAEGKAAEAYGVLRTMASFRMAKRQSFLVAPDGRIVRHYENVDPETHTGEVLADLRKLIGAGDASSG